MAGVAGQKWINRAGRLLEIRTDDPTSQFFTSGSTRHCNLSTFNAIAVLLTVLRSEGDRFDTI